MGTRASFVLFFFLFSFSFLTRPLSLQADDDMMARFGIDPKAERTSLFPQPQEKKLAEMREAPDQVVWVFREALVQEQAKGDGDGMAGFIADGMKGLRAETCWTYTRSLIRAFEKGDDRPLRKLADYLKDCSLPEDAAAFLPVLTRLPEAMGARIQGGHCVAQEQAARLEDEALRRDYLARVAEDGKFFRKKRFWMKAYSAIQKGVDGLIDRLSAHFCEENLIRFCERLSRSSLAPELKEKVLTLQSRLAERLHEEIVTDFEDRCAGGLVEKTRCVELVGNFVQINTQFFSGRIRRFSKRLQAFEVGDLQLFMSELGGVHRHVRQMARGGNWQGEVKDFLVKADQTLDNMVTVFRLKLRKGTAPQDEEEDRSLFSRIRSILAQEDGEGLFVELPEEVY